MDKILRLYKVNKKLFLAIIIITIIGIISGSLFYTILSNVDKTTVNETITGFFTNITNNQIDYSSSLKTGLITNIIYVLLIWLLGISLIGLPIILILYFFKAFTLGFTLVSIISNYAFKGVIYSFFYVFPHNIISLLSFAILSIYAIICFFNTIVSFTKKQPIDYKPIINRYHAILIITLLIVILMSLYQTFVMPFILKIILKFIK